MRSNSLARLVARVAGSARLDFCILAATVFCAAKPLYATSYVDEQQSPLQFYKPMYFIMGDPSTKIELSFKFKLIEDTGLYVGYTQLMFWDLFTLMPNVTDINYSPEIFYRWHLHRGPAQWIDFGFFQHESNGKNDIDERSWNRSYVRYHDGYTLGQETRFAWSFSAWVPYWFSEQNRDIAQYRGIWELEVSLADFGGPALKHTDVTFRLYPGGGLYINPLLGGQELMIHVKPSHTKFVPEFVAQLFTGYGESLLSYNHRTFGLRIGFGLGPEDTKAATTP